MLAFFTRRWYRFWRDLCDRFKREIEERPDGPCDRYPKGRKMRLDDDSEIETLDELIVRGHFVHIEAMDYDEYAIMVGPGPRCIYSMSLRPVTRRELTPATL
ncbi:MAG: hypothetical protein OXH70_17565 [Acidobacteria bacterium]|nr:hypothetical protein [Acidobacteriota bacterium]